MELERREKMLDSVTMRRLTLQEIDERMQRLVEDLAAIAPCVGQNGASCPDTMEPRWIEPAALIRRLRPFIVYN